MDAIVAAFAPPDGSEGSRGLGLVSAACLLSAVLDEAPGDPAGAVAAVRRAAKAGLLRQAFKSFTEMADAVLAHSAARAAARRGRAEAAVLREHTLELRVATSSSAGLL